MTLRTLLAVFAFLIPTSIVSAASADDTPRVFQFEPTALMKARQRFRDRDADAVKAVAQLRADADKMLDDGPYSVTKKKRTVPGADPHDYVSLAVYYWPDPSKPDGKPYINKDGQRNPELHDYDADQFNGLSTHVSTLSLAYYFTGDEKYADRAAVLLRTWFIDPATRMNPNFEHAQFVPGVNTGRGTGIIESLRLTNVVDALGMLSGSKSWSADDEAKLHEWFAQFLKWMRESKNGQDEANAANNHGTWYDVQAVTFALFVGDDASAKELLSRAPARMAKQIEPDGSQPQELRRTLALHYVVYNIQGMTRLADLGKRVNVDLWNVKTDDARGSLRAAIDWVLPYQLHEKPWTWQQIKPHEDSEMFIPLRRAEPAYHDPKYEDAVGKLKGVDPAASLEALLYPATRH